MQIPQREQALAALIRVLKPGGGVVLSEANTQSADAWLVTATRWIGKPKSQIVYPRDGVESWAKLDGHPFVVRVVNIANLNQSLVRLGAAYQARLASEF